MSQCTVVVEIMHRYGIPQKEEADCEERESRKRALRTGAKGRAKRSPESNVEGRIREWCCKSLEQESWQKKRVNNNISQDQAVKQPSIGYEVGS